MIKLGELHIEEFRGIRELDIDFKYESFVIHGPNGSGKSGVVDAIGFVLTGTIARLTGAGTRAISIRSHAPHVKSKDNPEAARVSLTFKDMKSDQVGTITRTVSDAANYTLAPDTPELHAAIKEALDHPELTLSRREIIKFILAESGKRADEVQSLLQLDKLETNRKILLTARNKVKTDLNAAKANSVSTKTSMETHLDITDLTADKVKVAVNPQRKVLGLKELPEVKLSTNLKEGLDEKTDEKSFDKQTALREIAAYQKHVDESKDTQDAIDSLLSALKELAKSADLELLKSRSFFETGLALVAEEGLCPLCDKAWHTPQELRKHLEQKIEGSKELARIDANIITKADVLKTALQNERNILKPIQSLSVSWLAIEDQDTLQARLDLLVEFETLLKDTPSAIALKDRLEAGALDYTDEIKEVLVKLKKKVDAQPDTSEKAKARNFLVLAGERWQNFASAKAAEARMELAESRAKVIYEKFCKVTDDYLDSLYASVEGRFSKFYGKINKDDEGDFRAEFKPSSGKLDLLVDFYGVGMFPPGAYHSEGHQDGMGICLYLALVEKILGNNFNLSVLDDVVMSVDVNHRRQFCELLKEEFPDIQFIVTTHDEIWAKQMQTTGLINSKSDMRFRGWSVDHGPIYEQGQVFWDKIDEDLNANDVPAAAHKLRRGLEAELPDIAEAIGARVAYRGDAKYDLGDLQNSVKGRHGELLKKAGASANSWKNSSQQTAVDKLAAARTAAVLTQDKEQWAVNLQVHFNEWANMSAADFKPVVAAWHDFIQLFTCDNPECGTWIEVTGKPGSEESLRCRCGNYSLNLLLK